ncbi:uncharacterized protein F5147DRAFT_763866 [Suillus discolor]|uniref:Uncharacterized protein n=1 Tax=Suillus discolor TaxID=1912936 RepID=A0A9P7EW20_9AGAM|nr:uncharacterized protein F5147DRAFT_763866 [Suillus discolor]KAG2094376.1 hypothetical protein F5147DRAFT_763866 [Suillus discolor]
MDYALCEASRHNMEGITRAVTFYDINCQYNKHFRVRVDRSRFLEMAPQLTIIPGIGLWHVHGHQDSCYVRYASNFIEGIGRIDGEIMETLWARLNLISPAARGMSSPHRKECLDYQMNDSNFCKMIRMKRTLCRKYKLARNGISESGKAFDRLDEAAPSHLKTEWLARERIAQSSRLNDPSAMDEYEINIKKAPSKKEIELRLLEEGLAIEEAQIALLIEVRRIGRRSTETQRLDIARQRDRLQGQIDGFARSALTHLGEGFDADDEPEDLNVDILDDLDDDPADFTETSHTWTNSPELTVIPLPSNLGVDRCRRCMAEDLIPLEMSLREGQANDALHNLRIYLCNKAILFRTTVRQAKSQALKTRAWSQVTSVQQAVSLHASIYTKTRKQMMKLEPGQDQLQKYKPLLREQLKISTAVGDPNARGQRNESLAWFWSVEVDLGGPDQSWNEEFYRVHWLRAKALRDRWREEMILVKLEMDWTSTQWGDHMQESLEKRPSGSRMLRRKAIPNRHSPVLAMPATPASTSGTLNAGSHYRPLKLSLATISCTLAMAGSRVRACISQYRTEAANNGLSSDRIKYFKAGLQWEMNYSASQNIVLVLPVPVAYILKLYPMLTWNTVPDDVFSFHLLAFDDEAIAGHPSRIVFKYTCPWWMGNTTIPDQPWQWDEIMASCISHYQYWALNVEDDALVLPEKLKNTSTPPLMGLRWIKERMEALMEEQDHGIKAKMAEVKMYTDMLEKLRKGKGVSRVPNFGGRGSETRSSATVLGVRVSRPLEIACGLGIQNSVKSQVTSSECRVPNPESRVPSPEFRRSGFGDPELGNCVGCQGTRSIGDSICVRDSVFRTVLSPRSRAPSPESRTPSPEFWRSGFGDLELGNCWLPSSGSPNPDLRNSGLGTRDSGFGTRHSELVTWDLTLF